jgi:UDP-N-acetylglucosamine enolpyruvyl transferase
VGCAPVSTEMHVRRWYNQTLLNISHLFTFPADFQAIFQKLTRTRAKFTKNKQFYIRHIFLSKLQRMGRNIFKKMGSLYISEHEFSEE